MTVLLFLLIWKQGVRSGERLWGLLNPSIRLLTDNTFSDSCLNALSHTPWLWAEYPHSGHCLYLPFSINCVDHILVFCSMVIQFEAFSKLQAVFLFYLSTVLLSPVSPISPLKHDPIHSKGGKKTWSQNKLMKYQKLWTIGGTEDC